VKYERIMPETAAAHRLFVALLPPADTAARIGAVRDGLQPRGHVANERLHITMGLLADMATLDEDILMRARLALSRVRAAPVQLCFDRLSSSSKTICLIPGERPAALDALQEKIEVAFLEAGLAFAPYWSFNPHMTLLYGPRERTGEAIMPISWCASEVVLVHSLIGLTRHIIVDRVALTPPGAPF
jgi:2'-5' RNA ligase